MSGPRSQARRYAVLALYQWQVTGQGPSEIARHFFDDPAWMDEVAESLAELDPPADTVYDRELFAEILKGVPANLPDIDGLLGPALDRPIAKVDPVERAILRVGAYEILYSPGIPGRVIVNEAVELAKLFGAEQGHRYVNGVLDRVARQVRPGEMTGGSGR